MLIAAAIIGLAAAYYFGVRVGLVLGGISAAAFLAAMVVPGAWLYAYGFVGVIAAGIFALGPKLGKPKKTAMIFSELRRVATWARRLIKRLP
jgi:hypothetical protein